MMITLLIKNTSRNFGKIWRIILLLTFLIMFVVIVLPALIADAQGNTASEPNRQIIINPPDPAMVAIQFSDGRWRWFCLNTCEAFVTWDVIDDVYGASFATQQEASNWWQALRSTLP